MQAEVAISILGADDIEHYIDALAALLRDCVRAGASIGFVLPFD